MSTSTHIIAFRDMDGEFARMLEVKQFCDMRKVSYPQEVTTGSQDDPLLPILVEKRPHP